VIVIETIMGNRRDPEWSERLSTAKIDLLEVDQWQAQKSRFRKTTVNATDLAISLDRGSHIHDGDVLHWDALASTAIVAQIDLRDVMIVHLDDLARGTLETAMRVCIELGHAMGNQHWPALVKDNKVYVPLVIDRKVMESVMHTHRFEDVRFEFVQGREVIPYLAPHETRRLFGGAEGPVHSHTHEHFVAVDAETGRVYGRPPVRVNAHSDPAAHSHRLSKDPAS
jgi:urease accessory protein